MVKFLPVQRPHTENPVNTRHLSMSDNAQDTSSGSQLSNPEKAPHADLLVCHLWRTQQKKTSRETVLRDPQNDLRVAGRHFDLGCQWLLCKEYPLAILQLKKSLGIYEKHQPPLNASIGSQRIFLEQKAKNHYALGLVQMGLSDEDGESNYYHAWKISASIDEDMIAEHAQCVMERVLSQKLGVAEAQYRMNCIRNSVTHELEGDRLYAIGQLRESLSEYRKCCFEEESMSYLLLAQAHIRCKMAMLYQSLDLFRIAGEEWTRALSIYQEELGLDHRRTIATTKRRAANYERGSARKGVECASTL